MELISVLSGAGVGRDLLYSAASAGILGGRLPSAEVDAALDQLASLSLLAFSLDGQTMIASSLVPGVVRAGLSARRLAEVCRNAAALLHAHAQASAEAPDRLAVRDISEQLTALAQVAGSVSQTDQELTMLLLQLRFLALYHLIELGDSAAQAIAVGEPLTADLEQALGPDHPDTLNARNSLAAAYRDAGRADEAIRLLEQTPDGRENVLGANHPDTVNSRINLAAAYREAGRAAEAIPLVEYILAAREQQLGADHPQTLGSRNNLANAYRDVGRVDEAIVLHEQTLAACERQFGSDHPRTLSSRSNLAASYQDAGRVDEAIPLLEQTLADRERVLGAGHPDTVTTRKYLALTDQVAVRAGEG
jgi:tetratricopeptide (TPR) repeat protein